MLADEELGALFLAESRADEPEDLVRSVLSKVCGCPFCRDLYNSRKDLLEHIDDCSANEPQPLNVRIVTDHQVDEGAEKLYICPFCGFALDQQGLGSPTSKIWDHVDACDEYQKVAREEHKRFRLSSDPGLITAYVNGQAEIEFYECNLCSETLGSRAGLHSHLASDHAEVELGDLADEQQAWLMSEARKFISGRESATPDEATEKPEESPIINYPVPPKRPSSGTPRPKPGPAPIPRPAKRRPVEVNLKTVFKHTVTADEINRGYCRLPARLRNHLGIVDRLTVTMPSQDVQELDYEMASGDLWGLGGWYLGNAIEVGDRLNFQLTSESTPSIRIWTTWQRNLDHVFRCPPEDFEWEHLPIRDCLLRVLQSIDEPVGSRSLYAEISKHRDLAPLSVVSVLSRYRGVLFERSKQGKWSLLGENAAGAESGNRPSSTRTQKQSDAELMALWSEEELAYIRENDLVFRLLKRNHQPMSFEQICDRMADHFQVDARMLARTDLLDPVDPRLVRLTNGNFSLREWLDEATEPDEPVESPDSPDEEPQETSQEPSISPEAVSKGQSHPRPKRSAVLLKIQQAFRRLIMALRWRAARRHT